VFNRRGARPFNKDELRRMYIHPDNGQFYAVTNDPPGPATEPATTTARK
jgi:hypothetical protein